jgi:hypothetical protein
MSNTTETRVTETKREACKKKKKKKQKQKKSLKLNGKEVEGGRRGEEEIAPETRQ